MLISTSPVAVIELVARCRRSACRRSGPTAPARAVRVGACARAAAPMAQASRHGQGPQRTAIRAAGPSRWRTPLEIHRHGSVPVRLCCGQPGRSSQAGRQSVHAAGATLTSRRAAAQGLAAPQPWAGPARRRAMSGETERDGDFGRAGRAARARAPWSCRSATTARWVARGREPRSGDGRPDPTGAGGRGRRAQARPHHRSAAARRADARSAAAAAARQGRRREPARARGGRRRPRAQAAGAQGARGGAGVRPRAWSSAIPPPRSRRRWPWARSCAPTASPSTAPAEGEDDDARRRSGCGSCAEVPRAGAGRQPDARRGGLPGARSGQRAGQRADAQGVRRRLRRSRRGRARGRDPRSRGAGRRWA